MMETIKGRPLIQVMIEAAVAWWDLRRQTPDDKWIPLVCRSFAKTFPDLYGEYSEYKIECGEHESEFGWRWGASGLPRIVLGHKHAAALMHARVPRSAFDSIRMPWEAFLVEVPAGLLPEYQFVNKPARPPVRYLGVWTRRVHRQFVPDGQWMPWDEIVFDHRRVLSDADLLHAPTPLQEHMENSEDAARRLRDPRARWNARVDVLQTRLLAGVLLEMNLHRPAPQGASGGLPHIKRDSRGAPVTTTVQLTRDVLVDYRPALRDFVTGHQRSPGVRHQVRGHWKRQPCGAGRRERKLVFVEDYPRGPEDAPIALRAHVLGNPAPEAQR